MVRTALIATNLSVSYDDHVALDDVSLTLQGGSTLAVIGPNGSGKSTLLHALAGLVEPTSGSLSSSIAGVALVLQSTDVDRSLPITVLEAVRMGRYAERGLLGRFREKDREVVSTAMARLDIGDLANRQLHDLSGGQRQRVLVAQGIAQEADLLLLDEPITGLDVVSRELILEVITAERNAGRAVVMTTHQLDDARRCDRVLLLSRRVIALGSPPEVITEANLLKAFGAGVLKVEGGFLMDDPHHTH